ncbi:MAG: REP-associated tyrosine transposase [Prosthecobacter sp.]
MNEPLKSSRQGPPHHPEARKIVERQRETSPPPTKEEQMAGFRGWQERGYLPHRDEPGLTQFVTFRLADSFPEERRAEWGKLLRIEDARERRAELEAWLDGGAGACHLRDARVAEGVMQKLRSLEGDGGGVVRAFTIMPNHIHLLLDIQDLPLAKWIQHLKGATARTANQLLRRTGPFWQADYWDTYMRDVEHEERTVRYIRNNPVKAGLVSDWKAWPWTYVREEG